jgi:hypothetical protein
MAAAIIDDGRVVDGVALPRLTDVQAALDMLSRSGLGEAKDLIGSSEWDALEAFAEMHDEHPQNPRRLLSVQKSPVMAGKRGDVEALISPKSKRNRLEADEDLDGCELFGAYPHDSQIVLGRPDSDHRAWSRPFPALGAAERGDLLRRLD